MKAVYLITSLLAIVALSAMAAPASDAAKKKQANKARKEAVAITDQLPQPVISYIYPAGGQRSSTVTTVVGGTNLVAGTNLDASIHVSGKGVTAHLIAGSNSKLARISVSIRADADLGEHTLRVVTKGGFSNRARFIVSDLAECNEHEPNNSRENPEILPPLPVVVNGQILQEDRDFYRFHAPAGHTLVISAQGRSLLPFLADAVPGWFDPVLTVYDERGKKLACVDDYHLKPDPTILFTPPVDGNYVVEISDSIFRGREDFVYRLTLGELPWITSLYPLGGKRGEKTSIELKGVNLDTNRIEVTLANDAPPTQMITAEGNKHISNPLPFGASDVPEVFEKEPNDSTNQATRVSVPSAINGQISRSGDDDWFVFSAAQGQKLVMEVFARRLESPLDSILTLYNSRGIELVQNDDTVDPSQPMMTHHADSRLVYTFSTAGDYFLRLRDVQNKGGEEFAYRLVISAPNPDFALRSSPDNPRVALGDCAIFTVNILRRDGFDGDIQLSVTNLPAGFTASDAIIQSGQDQASLTVRAPADAPLGLISPRIVGMAPDGSARTAVPAEAMMQAFAYTHLLPVDESLLTVLKAGSFSIAANPGTNGAVQIRPGTTNTIPLIVTRKENTRGGVAINVVKPPGGINARANYIQADKNEGTLMIVTPPGAKVGTKFNLIVTGTLRGPGAGGQSVAPAIPVEVVQ